MIRKIMLMGGILCLSPLFLKAQNVLVTIRSNSMLLIESSKGVITQGETTDLSVFGCTGTVSWSDGQKGEKIKVSPKTSTTYTATCVNAYQCVSSSTFHVGVGKPIPAKPVLSTTKNSICVGESLTLTASGCAGTVLWTYGSNTEKGSLLLISPSVSTTYKARCEIGEGNQSAVSEPLTIVAKKVPQKLVLSANPTTICVGNEAIIEAKGELFNVFFSDKELRGTRNIVSPRTTKTYWALDSLEGCSSDTSYVTVTVNPIPDMPVLRASEQTICPGSPISLVAESRGSEAITWSTGQTGNTITLSPRISTTYIAIASMKGCNSEMGSLTIQVRGIDISDLGIYPNPTTDRVKITSQGCLQGLRIRLFDVLGHELYDGYGIDYKEGAITLDLNYLPFATYIVQLYNDNGFMETRRIVKGNKN